MISNSKADDLILNSTSISEEEIINIESSIGRTLFKEIKSIRNQPPFHRVMMDGIALDSKVKSCEYRIENIQAAGSSQLTLKNNNNCIEVMTGAPLPIGCDCVIPYENINISKESNSASINIEDIIELNNIHLEATDYKAGDILLTKGTVITSPIVAIIASQGTREVSVFKHPKIAVISTGDELVELNSTVLPHQIYMSNSYAIITELEKFGIETLTRIHIIDDKDSTQKKIKELLSQNDILIITGGVSMGKFDYIPEVLSKLGVEQVFHTYVVWDQRS
jgi:molybdopterin molybdotransferase